MDQVLALTTPLMVDVAPDTSIAEAQHLLATSRFGNFHPRAEGSPIGTFGEDTAAACHRAKYWLGWPKGTTSGTYGRNLARYLETGHIPRDYWVRRQLRIRRAKQARNLRALHILEAEAAKHVTENPPGSNRVLYSEWYGMIGSWCLMFQTWGGVQAGEEWAVRGKRFAYCPYLDAAAANHQYGLSFIPASAVRPGDLVTYDWEHDGTSDHVGRFQRWIVQGSTFKSVEGNTAEGNDSNGGEVQIRDRSVSLVHHFIQVEG